MKAPARTYWLEIKDKATGLCMLWRGLPVYVADWAIASCPKQSELVEILGMPQEIFWREDPPQHRGIATGRQA